MKVDEMIERIEKMKISGLLTGNESIIFSVPGKYSGIVDNICLPVVSGFDENYKPEFAQILFMESKP